MKVGIYSPYLNILGGGERYMMTIAECLSQRGDEIDIFWHDEKIRNDMRKRLGINLEKINFVEDIFSSRINLFQKWQITRKYELIFYLSDGSVPFLFGKRNFLCFMVPFTGVHGRSLINQIKIRGFLDQVIAISKFTQKFIDQEYRVKSKIIFPPVATEEFKPGKKENLILSVGRFVKTDRAKGVIRPLHSKKQDYLINVFKEMNDQGLKDWRLVLAGGVESQAYVRHLKKLASGYPISLKTNIDFNQLRKYYRQAKIYWHAAGVDENEEKYPERMEHFGITTVEAMAAKAVPVVVNKGGQPEIVKQGINGFLWKTEKELINQTLQLIKSEDLWKQLASQATKDSQKFNKKVFCQKINELVKI